MNKDLLRKIVLALLGTIVLGFGIGMMAKVGLGCDSLSGVYTGVSKHTNLSLGTITAIANAIMVVVALILYKKNVGPATIIFIFVSKWPVDLATRLMVTSDNLFIKIVLCILSVFVLALGSELFILSDLGANAYDAVTMGIGKRLKHEVKYVYIRYACDGILLLVAFLIGGDLGLGTIICWALIGNFMKLWQGILVKTLHLETNSKLD